MKRTILAVALGAIGLAGLGSAQEGGMSEEMKAMMAEMQERTRQATALTEEHASLERYRGSWKVKIELVMPGAPEQAWSGRADNDWLIEGRWMGVKVLGELFGQPYEALSILGWDPYSKNHIVATISSADSALTVARGLKVVPDDSIQVLYGTLDEYTTNELNKPYKTVTRWPTEDRWMLEIWDLGIGESGAMVLRFIFDRESDGDRESEAPPES